jgi:Ca-activated chloride channel family protein
MPGDRRISPGGGFGVQPASGRRRHPNTSTGSSCSPTARRTTGSSLLIQHAAELTEEGIGTTTLGYGDDFNEDLLTALADAGRGSAYHVETADQAPTIFAQELEGLLAIAAQNVRVTFTPSRLVRRVDLCSAVEHHQDGKTLTVTVGDLVSEDTRSILVTFRVGSSTQEGWVGLGTITVTYDDVVGGIHAKTIRHELLVGAMAPGKVAAIPPDAAVVKELLILRAAKVLHAAIAQADAGDMKGAVQRLTDFLAVPEVAASTDPEIQAARRRLKELLHDLQDRGFDKLSRKQMHYCRHGWSGGKGGSAQ